METTFYHDEGMNRELVQKMKSTMTLDFNSQPKAKKPRVGGLLGSPDLNLLKLASPELEKMIIQQNGMVTTTPTPTQFIFPKYVTEEQEAYARGFVDALAELHDTDPNMPQGPNGQIVSCGMNIANITGMNSINSHITSLSMPNPTSAYDPISSTTTLSTVSPSTYMSTTTSLPGGGVMPTTSTSQNTCMSINHSMLQRNQSPLAQPQRVVQVKEEPQTVPCMGNTPPMSPITPINMETQEVIKLERKRARNRVAARKCRTRKLERISRLEERVTDLKDQNTDLSTTAGTLRDQVCRLKQQIMEHVNSGCQVMMASVNL